MIRFSAALVVVAVGVLIGGIVTSTLMLVYVAIALSAAALIVLAIGVALKRDELFGDAEPRFQVGDATGRSARPGQAYAGQPAAGQGWSRPGGQGGTATFQGVTGWSAPPGSGRGDVAETRTDMPATAAAPWGGVSSGGASRAGVPPVDATRTDMPAIDATRTDIPPISPVLADRPVNAIPAAPAPTGSAGAGAPRADVPRAAASPGVTETRLDMTAISADAPPGNDTRPAPRGDETRLDLPATPAGPPAPAGPVAPASSVAPASGTAGSKPGSGTRQVAVVPGVPRYHALNCILVRFMDEDDLEKMSQDEANAAGYTPCAACQADTGSFKVAE